MKNKLQSIKNKLASYIYIYIYRAAHLKSSNSLNSLNSLKSSNSLSSYIKFYRNFRVVGALASAALLLVMTLAVYPLTSKPNSAEAALGTASETTLTMTTSQDSASVALNPVGENGSFAASTIAESAAFSVTSNNITGYTLTMSNSSSTGELVSSTDSLTSISSITSLTDFSADTAAAASNYNGKWGYLPSKYNGTSNTTNYYPAPISTDPTPATLDTTNAPNSTANEYTIGIGARADMNKAAGAYTGTFVLQAIGNIVPYVITYEDNSEDSTVTGAPINPSTPTTGNIEGGTPSGDSITALATSIPTRTGYTFKSWCDGAVSSNGTVCTGTEYSSGANFPIDQTTQNITTLYAVWTLNTYTITISNSNTASGADSITVPYGGSNTVTVTPASGYYLSNVSCPSGYTCSGYSIGTSATGTQAVTIRNNNTTSGGTLGFTGVVNCSSIFPGGTMQAFDPSNLCSSVTSGTLTDSRDNQTYTVAKLADGNWWLLDNLRLGSTSTIALTPSDTNIASDWTLPAGITSGFNSYTAAQINVAYKDITTTSYGSGSGKIGVYYNYCAASAGTYCYDAWFGPGNASYDICPKGWRMPTGGDNGEYQALYAAYSYKDTKFRNALSATLSGYFDDSSAVGDQGSIGYFWSSTYGNGAVMHDLYVNSSGVGPTSFEYRRYGYSVRCLLKTRTIADVTNMQDVTSTVAANTTEGATATLTDSRDNQQYTVAKINGNLWMTRNLAIGCNGSGTSYGSNRTPRSLNSSNSNVSTTWSTGSAGALTSGNSYTEPRMQCSTSYGAWYNYAAATANTINTVNKGTDSSEAKYSVCPTGWWLPTDSEQSGITSYSSAFSPVAGGAYENGSLDDTSRGNWWSSIARNGNFRNYLLWNGSSLDTGYGFNRGYGIYVRCVVL